MRRDIPAKVERYEKVERIESLDYLRGVMAVTVMVYHYSSWTSGTLGGEYLLGKFGIYAVSIFYILSGLSLTVVYHNKIIDIPSVKGFIIKRIFRIFPLFWLVVSASIVLKYASSRIGSESLDITVYEIFLNYSLLFGFLDPAAYLSTGAWSIGNEMVFYTIFPFIFLLSSRFQWAIPLAIVISVLLALYFAFIKIDQNSLIGEQWSLYINPFNQLFLFMVGVGIGKWGGSIQLTSKVANNIILILIFLLFWLWPSSGDKIEIITGFERVVYSLFCITFVLTLYNLNPKLSFAPNKILCYLGQGCYSIYLLHPIIAMPIVFIAAKYGFSKPLAYLLSLIITLFISGLTFKYIEKPMMGVGKKISETLNCPRVK